MKKRIMVFMSIAAFAIPVLGLTDDNSKGTFNHDQGLYNDKANKDFRAKQIVQKDTTSKNLEKKKIKREQDAKGIQNEKNEHDEKNEQYDQRLIVKF